MKKANRLPWVLATLFFVGGLYFFAQYYEYKALYENEVSVADELYENYKSMKDSVQDRELQLLKCKEKLEDCNSSD